jgi:hypothetical protein
VDTDGRRAAVVFANLDTSFNSYDHDLRVVPLAGGRARTLDSGVNTEDCQHRVVGPTLAGGDAIWIHQGSSGYAVARGAVGAGGRSFGPGVTADAAIVSAAANGTRLVLADAAGVVSEQPLPVFAPARPAVAFC